MTPERLQQAQEALRGLVKLIKAVSYYPPGHPALGGAAEQALASFSPLLLGVEKALFTVRKEGFSFEESPVPGQTADLAPLFFGRRIRSLLILPELSGNDLEIFARTLTEEAGEIPGQGGLQAMLKKAGVSTIWINELDLSEALLGKEAMEARDAEGAKGEEEPPPPPPEKSEKPNLKRILLELREEISEERYSLLIRELVPRVREDLTARSRPLVLNALALLCRNASDRGLSEARGQNCRDALAQLTENEVLDFIVLSLCTRKLEERAQEGIMRILACQGEKAADRLMNRLVEEAESPIRRRLSRALVRQGTKALPTLVRYLADERWYVVRNAAAILGEIGSPEAVPHLAPLLAHPESRVRREAIRAYPKIGDPRALDSLLPILEEREEMLPEALLCLGALKDPAAVPPLLKLLKKADPLGRMAQSKRGVVMALGEIGSKEAVPPLTATLKKRPLWRRRRNDMLRAACARALGEIGDPASVPALERAALDRSTAVARAASRALESMAQRSKE